MKQIYIALTILFRLRPVSLQYCLEQGEDRVVLPEARFHPVSKLRKEDRAGAGIYLTLTILSFYLFSAGILNSAYAQAPATTNTGTFYIGTGGIVATEGSFTNTAAGTTQNEGNMYLMGDWANNGTFTSNAGTVTFWGSTTQNVTGSVNTGFFNMTLNNYAGGMSLGQKITVAGTLALTKGMITTSSNEVSVTNSSTSAITPYSDSGYVIGYLRRAVNSSGTYEFPLGTAAYYELAGLNFSSATGFSNVLGSFTNAIPNPTPLTPGLNVNGRPITDMLNYGYWTLTPNSTMTGGNYTVTIGEAGATNAGGPANIYCVIKREDAASPWQSLGTHNDNTQSISENIVTAVRSALSSFSDYGIGFNGAFLLPIELLSFNAVMDNEKKVVDLTWVTASEQNSDYFMVERSANGTDFSDLIKVKGAGTSTTMLTYKTIDAQPLTGISYYRLRQVDLDGKLTYSQIRMVNNPADGAISFTAMPNPTTSDNINLNLSGVQNNKISIKLTDVLGKIYYETVVTPNSSNYNLKLAPPSTIAAGCYFIEINSGGKLYSKRVVVQ